MDRNVVTECPQIKMADWNVP